MRRNGLALRTWSVLGAFVLAAVALGASPTLQAQAKTRLLVYTALDQGTVDADLEGGPTLYRVQVVGLDPRTGRGLDRARQGEAPLTFSKRDPWQEAITELRARLQSSS